MNSKKLLSKITVGLLTVSVGAATFANPVENVELVDGGIGQAVSNGEEEIVEEAEEVKENVELSEAVVDEGAQQVAEEESADAEMQISFLAETEESSTESQTDNLTKDQVIITNNAKGTDDTIVVNGIQAGAEVKVYNSATATTPLKTAVVANGSTSVTISIAQLGQDPGVVYISITEEGQLESEKLEFEYSSEPKTDAIDESQVEINNNANAKDTVTVTGLAEGDIVKVYSTEDKILGTATVEAGKTEAVVTIAQLGEEATTVKVSLTSKDKLESDKLEVEVAGEETTEALAADKVVIVNNVTGKKDTVTVSGLAAGTILKVYAAEEDTKAVGTATAVEDKDTVINLAQLGVTEGSVYVTVTAPNEKESTKVKVDFKAEAVTDTLKAEQVKVANNANAKDTVTVTDLAVGDIVKVYGAEDQLLGKATVGTGKTEAVVSIAQLGETAGEVYITNTTKGALESEYFVASYKAEAKSAGVEKDKVVIINNIGTDAIFIYGLKEGTVVNVYNAETEGSIIAKATVAANQSQVYITVQQLGAESGSVYISLTEVGSLEGDRAEISFEKEIEE